MARTFIPEPRALDPKMTLEEVLKQVHDELVYVYADYDKTGDMDSYEYYAGMIDAYYFVERLLTVADPDERPVQNRQMKSVKMGVTMRFPYFGIKQKPCAEIIGTFSWGPQFCNILTRRRWRDGIHFRPICNTCNKE